MKKIILSILTIPSVIFACAQPGKTKTQVKTQGPVCKNLLDSASYAVGVSVASFYKRQGITKLNTALVLQAINDILGGKQALLNEATCNSSLNGYINSLHAEKAKVNIDAGENFLAQNKSKPGVKTTASGMQYEVLTEGTGAKPTAADRVTCHYKGTLLDGSEFDNSYNRGQPITFSLGGVIAGWTEGLQLMSVGSKYRFWIPYNLGYGVNGNQGIPGGALLIFEVELIEIPK